MNTLEQISGQLLEGEAPNRSRQEDVQLHRVELDAMALMWRIPWEQERHQRILRAAFEGDQQQLRQAIECGPLIVRFLGLGIQPDRLPRGKRDVARLRAAKLKAALRWYQAETGKLPQTLDALVPRYLPAIPTDPFDNKPFRYRLSRGERIGWIEDENAIGVPPQPGMPGGPGGMPGMPGGPPGGMMPGAPGMPAVPQMPTRLVPVGQGILWAVGEDGQDDGGKKQGRDSGTMFGEDKIFLVPPPPE